MYGFYRIAVAVPAIVPGDVTYNCNEIIRLCSAAKAAGAAAVFFPRLALTGAGCGELFFQKSLLDAAERATAEIAGVCEEDFIAVFGTPYRQPEQDEAWDVFAVAGNGVVQDRVPSENYDRRFFRNETVLTSGSSGFYGGISFALHFSGCPGRESAEIDIFSCNDAALPGVSGRLENFAAASSRAAGNVAVVTTGCAGESTAGFVTPAKAVIACNGKILASTPMLSEKSELIFADVDLDSLKYQRARSGKVLRRECFEVETVLPESPDLRYAAITPKPYLPEDEAELKNFCAETLEIQSFALAHRMKKAFAKTMILGISGGLDSTLALVVLNRTCRLLGISTSSIIAVTMPGFGTTGRTKNNALELAKIIGATVREIPIAEACMQHFFDINHDPAIHNAVYENTQARERTQILMDIANAENGLVIGTGDLSEISMGWCTYNGDQMSMYSLNSTVMKSVIPELLRFEAQNFPAMAQILQDVIDTPVSPELLPAENGTPGHCTEEILGAYEIHDFFIWHFINCGAGKEKILALAEIAFEGKYDRAEIERCYNIFSRRFFSQQFKRSASPEGVNANEISLNPGEWRMASDVSGILWK